MSASEDDKALTASQRKPLLDLFLAAHSDTSIFRLTLRDGGPADKYCPLLEIPEVRDMLTTYGYVYSHLLITCPSRWILKVASTFRQPAHELLNPANYYMKTNGSTQSTLLDDSHQTELTEEQFKHLLANRGMGGAGAGVHSYHRADINTDTAAHTAEVVRKHIREQASDLVDRLNLKYKVKAPFAAVKPFAPPQGHTVVQHSRMQDSLSVLVEALELEWRHAFETWYRHAHPERYLVGIPKLRPLSAPVQVSFQKHTCGSKQKRTR